MIDEWRQRRAMKRIRPGDGRPLPRFRWWQQVSRSLFSLELRGADGRRIVYAVDVRHMGDQDGRVLAQLYLDGRHHATSKVPAAFPVEGGVIEVAASMFGLKRCHYVTQDGGEAQLVPDRASAAGRRARLGRDHPALSRLVGSVSVLLLVLGVVVVALELLDVVGRIPPVVDRYGGFRAPVQPPLWVTVAAGLGAVSASIERGLRLRYHWLLDGAAS
ncbi:hypothetical protein [Geodermatophilus marinus]|uniref:hypothetical protein n=1 Tax=Geodermatophilus sp. LHW52908 TaxID=2303986 RepID=UPI000E3EDA3F|nr:hypothetical protein [Geodermatophilus sp. LHW52908]RFU20069.1 hypothetical protein D0Z06_18340 [Geodermatophilus sp. LHW52908]